MRLRRRTRALVGGALAAVAFAVAGPVQPAAAAPTPITLSGDATSHLGWLINADVNFPATFDGSVDLATSAIEGEMTMGEGTISFNALGLLPATTTVQLDFTEPVTGTIDLGNALQGVHVGGSSTGLQLAQEIHASGRPVTLAANRSRRRPMRDCSSRRSSCSSGSSSTFARKFTTSCSG